MGIVTSTTTNIGKMGRWEIPILNLLSHVNPNLGEPFRGLF